MNWLQEEITLELQQKQRNFIIINELHKKWTRQKTTQMRTRNSPEKGLPFLMKVTEFCFGGRIRKTVKILSKK